jgi:hypothetical protein
MQKRIPVETVQESGKGEWERKVEAGEIQV